MRKRIVAMALAGLVSASFAPAAEDPLQKGIQGALDTFSAGCQQELTTYCKDVTPGKGRILACLYAFEDKLSTRCQFALYDSISQLNRTLATLSYAVNECRDDLKSYCAEVKPGEGRLLECLERNDAKVSTRCRTALEDTGLK